MTSSAPLRLVVMKDVLLGWGSRGRSGGRVRGDAVECRDDLVRGQWCGAEAVATAGGTGPRSGADPDKTGRATGGRGVVTVLHPGHRVSVHIGHDPGGEHPVGPVGVHRI